MEDSQILSNLLANFRRLVAQPAAAGQEPLFLNTVAFRAGELEVKLGRELAHKREVGAPAHEVDDLTRDVEMARLLRTVAYQRAELVAPTKGG